VQGAIEARAVGLRTRTGEVAVRDISLTVEHGELVAITGTGLGKATLLDAMSGLRPPTSGAVVRSAGPAAGPRPSRPAGYVPADDMMHPVLPLATALRYAAALRSVPAQETVDAALSLAGLAASAAVPVGALNPGERKRAAIAGELLAWPAQLFLDEPTAGLDPPQAAEVLRMLRRLADSGMTVVLTTSSPLDAARCDKVALLASGGDLAFFGTTEAARGYFGADSLEEIYERLAGVGDPAAAWSRRFFHFARAGAGFAPPAPAPPGPAPAFLVPESAGPHSAGRVTVPADWTERTDWTDWVERADWSGSSDSSHSGDEGLTAELVPAARNGQAGAAGPAAGGGSGSPGTASVRTASARDAARDGALVRPVRQLPVLIKRNAEIAGRSPFARAVLVTAPAAVLLAFAALIGAGAFNGTGVCQAWPVLGGFCIGLAYGLPQVRGELGVLRAERFGGLSATAYVLAKLAVLLPALAAAGAVALAVPAAFGRLPQGYGPGYLTLLLCSAVALVLALLLSVAAAVPATISSTGRPVPAVAIWPPAVLLAAAVLTLLDRPAWPDWMVLAALFAFLVAAAIAGLARRVPAAPAGRQSARF
jgi:ABC-type multidrug transport system ATPase subunit